MEALTLELKQAMAHRDAAFARMMASQQMLVIDPEIKARGYAAIKIVTDARYAQRAADAAAYHEANAAYASVKARFLAAYHNR